MASATVRGRDHDNEVFDDDGRTSRLKLHRSLTMTPRERVLAVLRGAPVDKVPLTIYEAKIPQCAVERRLRNEGMCIVNRSIPAVRAITPNCITETRRYVRDGVELVESVVRTPVGELSEIRRPAGFTSWAHTKLFKRPEDYRVLRFMMEDQQFVPDYDAYRAAEEWMGEDVLLRGAVGATPLHEIMIAWMGVEVFAVEWAERRDEILELVRLIGRRQREVYSLLADSPITHANYGGNEVPEVMGPPRFAEFCVPLYEECAAVLHRRGKLLGVHLDGNNRAWAELVAGSSLDYVEAFTPAPDTDMTLAEALSAWPDKVLWINFPSSLHVASLDVIRKAAREIVALARETNRVIVGITEDIPAPRWQANLLAISEVVNRA